jgi:CubicO group peptidase (beta-lactamase class C family)
VDEHEPAHRLITIEDLMTHRSGLAYAFTSSGPIAQAHEDALGSPLDSKMTPDEWLGALSKLPLSYKPGERLHYSHATEVLGFIVGRIAGAKLGDVLKAKIFGPLGMVDTAFHVPPEKRDRAAELYRFDDAQEKLVRVPMPHYDAAPAYEAGGGGLWSTVDDYLKFARMLLNHGEVDGVRLLKAETVRDMRTNRLTPEQREAPFLGMPMWAGMGFGLGLSVVDAPEKNMMGVGSPGSFGWPGAFGTWWQADPVKDLILIYMIQHSIPLTPDAGEAIAAGRGFAGRMALPMYQRAIYDALA